MSKAIKLKGKLVPFEPIREPWGEYQLADGNFLRVRLNIIAVYNTGKKNPDGKPNYTIQSNFSIGTFTEEEGYVRMPK